MSLTAMDHGLQLKTSGWPMAGIRVDERVQQLDSFLIYRLVNVGAVANKKNSKMLVFYYKACYN